MFLFVTLGVLVLSAILYGEWGAIPMEKLVAIFCGISNVAIGMLLLQCFKRFDPTRKITWSTLFHDFITGTTVCSNSKPENGGKCIANEENKPVQGRPESANTRAALCMSGLDQQGDSARSNQVHNRPGSQDARPSVEFHLINTDSEPIDRENRSERLEIRMRINSLS